MNSCRSKSPCTPRTALVCGFCLSMALFGLYGGNAGAQEPITLDYAGGQFSEITFEWTADSSGEAVGRTVEVVPGVVYAVITEPSGSAVPSDEYDVRLKQTFQRLDGSWVVLEDDMLAGQGLDRSDTGLQLAAVWPEFLVYASGFLQVEVSGAGAGSEGRVTVQVFRSLRVNEGDILQTLQVDPDRLLPDPLSDPAFLLSTGMDKFDTADRGDMRTALGFPDPDTTPSFMVSTDGAEWSSTDDDGALGLLGFLDPVFNRKAPGDIGQDLPGNAIFNNLLSVEDPENIIDYSGGLLLNPIISWDDALLAYLPTDDTFTSQMNLHKSLFTMGATEWINRHRASFVWDIYPGTGATEQDRLDNTRAFLRFEPIANTDVRQKPWFYVDTQRPWMLFPSTKSGGLVSPESGGPAYYKTAFFIGGRSVGVRDDHEVFIGNRNPTDPRDPALEARGGDPRFIIRYNTAADEIQLQWIDLDSTDPNHSVNRDETTVMIVRDNAGTIEVEFPGTVVMTGTLDLSDATVIDP